MLKETLFLLSDPDYKKFTASLIPNVSQEKIIGVRIPKLRKIAKELIRKGRADAFLSTSPYTYHEEKLVAALIISELEFEECIPRLDSFLPEVDNWAVCDSLRPRCFKSFRTPLLKKILVWLSSEHTYTKRFAVEMLMLHYLGEDFKPEFFDTVSAISSEDYYLNMMIAWYFATALAERYEETLAYIESRKLSPWVHNKAISKAMESLRIDGVKKEYLKTLRIKTK